MTGAKRKKKEVKSMVKDTGVEEIEIEDIVKCLEVLEKIERGCYTRQTKVNAMEARMVVEIAGRRHVSEISDADRQRLGVRCYKHIESPNVKDR